MVTMKPNRVKHIIAKQLDDTYVETLCGRVVNHCVFMTDEPYREYGYVEWASGVNCQNCLRKHYKEANRK
jgi:hypothetical protein